MSGKIPVYERLRAFQLVNIEWRAHLSQAERDLIAYFVANSIGYGRPSIRMSLDQMVSGSINPRTGKLWLMPCGMSRSTVGRTIASLYTKGALLVQAAQGRRAASYAPNLEWDYPMRDKFPLSKAARARMAEQESLHPGAEEDGRSMVKLTPLRDRSVVNLTPTVYKEGEYEKNHSRSGKPDGGLGGEVRDNAEALIKSIRDRKPSKAQGDNNVTQIWREAHATGELGIPPLLSKKGLGQLARVRDRLGEQGPEFLSWAVSTWPQIIAGHFGWMDRQAPPSRPDPGFLLGHANTFIEAFGIYQRSQVSGGTLEEQELRRLMETGLSPEESLIEIGRRRALGDERGELAKERKRLKEEFDALEGERKTLRGQLVRPIIPPEPPVVLDHGDNPWDRDDPPNVETEFGEFE